MGKFEVGRFARKLADQLFSDLRDREEFLSCLAGRPDRDRAVVWVHGRSGQVGRAGPDWWPENCELVDGSVRMSELAEHESGLVYALDPSSVFEGGILQALLTSPLDPLSTHAERGNSHVLNPGLVIDVCAAPGGKSMMAQAILQPKKLICNEVIGKRLGMLRSNLTRCGVHAEVTHLDPQRLADQYKGQADVVIVDAPCSGQSVLVKGGENPGCFHPRTVQSNAMRQRRILSESARMVRSGGALMYSTCTYSPEENERLVEWFLGRADEFAEVEFAPYAPVKSRFGPGYREWPNLSAGVGGYTCLLRRRHTV